jgi:hypothetical protein
VQEIGTSIVIVTKKVMRKISSIERIIKQNLKKKPSGMKFAKFNTALSKQIKDTGITKLTTTSSN